MQDTRRRIQSLTPEELARLKQKLANHQVTASKGWEAPERGESGPCPLSFPQRPMWFFDQMEPGSAVYNRCANFRLLGSLDTTAMQQALDALVVRHESLRTVFSMEGEEPVQVVLPQGRIALEVSDLTVLASGEREARLKALVIAEAERPFDLSKGPLLRVSLVRLGAREHVLMTTMHHIISDAWSSGVFKRELGYFYKCFRQKRQPDMPELPLRYVDYTRWQLNQLRGKRFDKQLHYWKERLDGVPPLLELPCDRPRPAVQTFRGGTRSRPLNQALGTALLALGQRQGATLFMLLLAAFQVLLYRYSGQEDIVVGTPVANRGQKETEGLIGLFINVLALRCDLSGDPAFPDLIVRVREAVLGAFEHQEVPFEKLVEALQPERNLSHTPLFQVMFTYRNTPDEELDLDGVAVHDMEVKKTVSHFDLSMIIERRGEGHCLIVEYSADLFDAGTITRMLDHYVNLLEGIAAGPDRRISQLPLLGEAEREWILREWNATASPYPAGKGVHQLFERQCARAPGRLAAVYGAHSLSYGDLNARANRLARMLRARGVDAGTLVGLLMERSCDMVVALLAILKAGGGYVPLDPDYPRDRLALMLEECQASVLLTHSALVGRLPEHTPSFLCLDRIDEDLRAHDDGNLDSRVTPDAIAYVNYTSGSTGKPKGVCVPHRAVNRLVLETNYIELGEADRVAQVSTISFDAATFEIWGALLNGATLVGADKQTLLSADEFSDWLSRERITAMFLTTAVFNHLAEENPAMFSSLDCLLFGGEAADPKRVRAVWEAAPPRHLINVYGPTENTTFSTWHEITELPDESLPVPIGRPIANTQAYILDQSMNPVPVGVYGELYLGGAGLALGYLNNQALTRERFVLNPFSEEPGARLYRTGDMARYLADGKIVFHGRTDDQVKIRGFRIEPGEIEATIRLHPAVGEAVVVCTEEPRGEKRLSAYVTAKVGDELNMEELRTFLSEKLPPFMVPSTCMILGRFPLTDNGKIDRKALPAPDFSGISSRHGDGAPRTELERELVAIWEDLFERKGIGVHDDFFHLGGHSLLAARLFSILNSRYKRDIPLMTIYQAGTIAQIASLLTGHSGRSPVFSSLAASQAQGSKPPFFWALGSRGGNQLMRYFSEEQPLYVLQHQAQDGYRARYTRINEIARWYLCDIRAVQPRGPYFLGGFSFGGMIAYEIARQIEESGDEVGLLFLLDASQPGLASRRYRHAVRKSQQHPRQEIQAGPPRKVWRLIRRGINVWRGRLDEWGRLLVCHACFVLRVPLPVALRSFYILRIYKKEALGYKPVPLRGRVVCFQFDVSSEQSAPNSYAECNPHAEVYSMQGNHKDVTSQSHAPIWTRKLIESLAGAQDSSGASRS
ncbi:MAG TPA: amino acid adenylation domain-containing protein [Gammaproteobacteria bacterium]|nr:amino acid adenylation domain-containing protein [Gammaproteobacteria bacterium]